MASEVGVEFGRWVGEGCHDWSVEKMYLGFFFFSIVSQQARKRELRREEIRLSIKIKIEKIK